MKKPQKRRRRKKVGGFFFVCLFVFLRLYSKTALKVLAGIFCIISQQMWLVGLGLMMSRTVRSLAMQSRTRFLSWWSKTEPERVDQRVKGQRFSFKGKPFPRTGTCVSTEGKAEEVLKVPVNTKVWFLKFRKVEEMHMTASETVCLHTHSGSSSVDVGSEQAAVALVAVSSFHMMSA